MATEKKYPSNLTAREITTILAALRMWQDKTSDEERNADLHFTAALRPLNDKEIDDLCDYINEEV